MSIKPKWWALIRAGRKLYELRRRPPRSCSRVVVYASSPVCAIVGEFECVDVLRGDADSLLRQVGDAAAVGAEEFRRYIGVSGGALRIGEVIEYDSPQSLDALRHANGAWHPPQSWRYLRASAA